MIKVLVGDIFKSKAQTLVNTVNCVGVMGKGLALLFKKMFPDMFEDYYARYQRGEVQLGKPYLYKRLIPPWILLFPTKQDWRSLSRLSDIEAGLRYLQSKYQEWGITSIAVPPLGCGLGELEWSFVGRTLYRYLEKLEIPVELYAPYGTSERELTSEFLSIPSPAQLFEESSKSESKIKSGFIPIIEVLRRIEELHYHLPIGRVVFQKIAYFGTLMGLKTGLGFRRGSFGPFSPQLKYELTKLINNGLISEEKHGNMFKINVGRTYKEARQTYKNEIESKETVIEKLIDLFSRLRITKQAEIVATVHFARKTMIQKSDTKPTEEDVLNEVMNWKQKRRPPYNRTEIAKAIRNLAVLEWIDVEPSRQFPKEIEIEIEA